MSTTGWQLARSKTLNLPVPERTNELQVNVLPDIHGGRASSQLHDIHASIVQGLKLSDTFTDTVIYVIDGDTVSSLIVITSQTL